jgi:hypothetical protein
VIEKIDFSPIESRILGLKIGRCQNDLVNEADLYKQIVDSQYDLCRLKVPAEDEMISSRLNKTGLPFFFSGSIQKYKTPISESPAGSYRHALTFEMYDGSQNELLKDMLIDTWGSYPLGYYRTPFLQNLITKEKEIECVYEFYKKFNLNRDYSNNFIMFMNNGSAYVGFFGLNIVGNNLETHIGGILSPYRKSGYFLDQLRYIKEFCFQHGFRHFIFGARNENSQAQRVHQYAGFQPMGSDNVFHITSLLTLSQRDPIIMEIINEAHLKSTLYEQLLNISILVTKDFLPDSDGLSFLIGQIHMLRSQKIIKLNLSFPVMNSDELLMVIRATSENSLPCLGYFRKFKR